MGGTEALKGWGGARVVYLDWPAPIAAAQACRPPLCSSPHAQVAAERRRRKQGGAAAGAGAAAAVAVGTAAAAATATLSASAASPAAWPPLFGCPSVSSGPARALAGRPNGEFACAYDGRAVSAIGGGPRAVRDDSSPPGHHCGGESCRTERPPHSDHRQSSVLAAHSVRKRAAAPPPASRSGGKPLALGLRNRPTSQPAALAPPRRHEQPGKPHARPSSSASLNLKVKPPGTSRAPQCA